jgi:UMP-CMP kinase
LDGFLEVFGDLCKVICVLFLDCPIEKCFERISIRSQSSGRIDDNTNSLKKRFTTFEFETLPNVKNLEKITKIVRVDSWKDSMSVFNDICEKLDGVFESYI